MLTKQPSQTINSITAVPTAICYPLHGDTVSRVAGNPTLAFATGASGNWNAQGYYAFPAGNTTDVMNSDNSLLLDATMSMVGMQTGEQWIIAHEQTTPNHTGTGFIWCYGNDGSSQSQIALAMINTEVLQFSVRGVGASAAVSHTWSAMSPTLALTGQRCTVVTSIEAQSATEVLVKVLYRTINSSAQFNDTGYSALINVAANGATANPGRATINHAGLTLGARPTTGWTPANRATIGNYASIFGNGTGNGRLGNFCAKKFASYDPARSANIAAALWDKPREVPQEML